MRVKPLPNTGMVAPLVIDGPINGEWFGAYVGQVLVPTLKRGDVVILDNLSSHKRPAAREMIEAAGARMMFLQPYSPNFNPIENAFSNLKALLRKAAGRTVTRLWDRTGKLINFIEPHEAQNYFNSCGYDPIMPPWVGRSIRQCFLVSRGLRPASSSCDGREGSPSATARLWRIFHGCAPCWSRSRGE